MIIFPTKKIKNVPKLSNTNIICNKCNSKFETNNKICLNCKKYLCHNCFRGNNNGNLDNNSDDNENYEQNFDNENVCHYCKTNLNINKNNKIMKHKRNKHHLENEFESLDNYCENTSQNFRNCKSKTNVNDFNKEKIKNLEEQYKEYENFLKLIDNRKKEIEIKRDINLNILQMIKKAIEYEYNLKKLNEFQSKLIKIKNVLNEKIKKNYQNEIDLQININISKNSLKNHIKSFEKYNQLVISRPLFRGYKSYESNNILINYSDSYYMKNKEVLSDLPFGNLYIRIDRYSNN